MVLVKWEDVILNNGADIGLAKMFVHFIQQIFLLNKRKNFLANPILLEKNMKKKTNKQKNEIIYDLT